MPGQFRGLRGRNSWTTTPGCHHEYMGSKCLPTLYHSVQESAPQEELWLAQRPCGRRCGRGQAPLTTVPPGSQERGGAAPQRST